MPNESSGTASTALQSTGLQMTGAKLSKALLPFRVADCSSERNTSKATCPLCVLIGLGCNTLRNLEKVCSNFGNMSERS